MCGFKKIELMKISQNNKMNQELLGDHVAMYLVPVLLLSLITFLT